MSCCRNPTLFRGEAPGSLCAGVSFPWAQDSVSPGAGACGMMLCVSPEEPQPSLHRACTWESGEAPAGEEGGRHLPPAHSLGAPPPSAPSPAEACSSGPGCESWDSSFLVPYPPTREDLPCDRHTRAPSCGGACVPHKPRSGSLHGKPLAVQCAQRFLSVRMECRHRRQRQQSPQNIVLKIENEHNPF